MPSPCRIGLNLQMVEHLREFPFSTQGEMKLGTPQLSNGKKVRNANV